MPCCGVPEDEVLNGCGRSADWLVLAPQVRSDTAEIVMCLLGCCTGHREAVEAFQARWVRVLDGAEVQTFPISELEALVGLLLEEAPAPLLMGLARIA